jgi:ribosomal protein S26
VKGGEEQKMVYRCISCGKEVRSWVVNYGRDKFLLGNVYRVFCYECFTNVPKKKRVDRGLYFAFGAGME